MFLDENKADDHEYKAETIYKLFSSNELELA